MADPHDAIARSFYDAEMRGVVRALIAMPFPTVSEIRAIVTNAALDRHERASRLQPLAGDIDPTFLLDYAFWLPWDDIKPGIDPDDIEQYRSR